MSVTREQQRAEAHARLKFLVSQGLHPQVLADFDDGVLNYSDRLIVDGPEPIGILYWMSNTTAVSQSGKLFSEVVAEFEERFNAVVYHATHEFFEFGEVLDLFYVSQYDEEWERDRNDLEHGLSCVMASNLDDSLMSDIGTIRFAHTYGGLIRTA